ncbi:hypothetical protein [Streptomyces sp. NPDC005533]|uniref:hypothetical protein n=1 Tax=Streptomyces sp. NPDC005533 TaxID=3364723 RepID=UPI0036A74499
MINRKQTKYGHLAVAALSAVTLAFAQSPASAASAEEAGERPQAVVETSVDWKIKLAEDPKLCLNLNGGWATDGTAVQVADWYCTHSNDNTAQQFTYTAEGRLKVKDKCVSAIKRSGAWDTKLVILASCGAASVPLRSGGLVAIFPVTQNWLRGPLGTLQLTGTNYCLYAPEAKTDTNTGLITCGDLNAKFKQRWIFASYYQGDLGCPSPSTKNVL